MREAAISESTFSRLKKRQIWRLTLFCSILTLLIIAISPIILASNADISRSYKGEENIVPGSLVSLDQNKNGYVVLANSNSKNRLVGVAVKIDSTSIALDANAGNIQVAISGNASAIVSTLNGDINVGDAISESPISGVGAKALPGDKTVGVAQRQFNLNSENTKKQTIYDKNGKSKEILVGYTQIMVVYNTAPDSGGDNTSSIEQWASAFVGHDVSMARIVVCGVIAIVALFSLLIMIYSAIHNAITAVSRNPLAKSKIFEALAQVMIMVVIVCIISLTTMYLVIRL